MFVRERRIGAYRYLYLVETVREDGKTKQRIIRNLGRKEAVEASDGRGAQGTTHNVVTGIDWAFKHGARVVNLSFGGPRDELLSDALASGVARRMIFVASRHRLRSFTVSVLRFVIVGLHRRMVSAAMDSPRCRLIAS